MRSSMPLLGAFLIPGCVLTMHVLCLTSNGERCALQGACLLCKHGDVRQHMVTMHVCA